MASFAAHVKGAPGSFSCRRRQDAHLHASWGLARLLDRSGTALAVGTPHLPSPATGTGSAETQHDRLSPAPVPLQGGPLIACGYRVVIGNARSPGTCRLGRCEPAGTHGVGSLWRPLEQ